MRDEPAYSRATECSPGRVREPWVRPDEVEESPRTRGRRSVAPGESASPGYARTRWKRARVLAGDSELNRALCPSIWAALLTLTVSSPSPASTRARVSVRAYPGLADSPWATLRRPRVRGLV